MISAPFSAAIDLPGNYYDGIGPGGDQRLISPSQVHQAMPLLYGYHKADDCLLRHAAVIAHDDKSRELATPGRDGAHAGFEIKPREIIAGLDDFRVDINTRHHR